MIQKPKGTKDLLQTESHKWQYVENKVKEQVRETVLKGNPKYRILKERGIL